LWRYLSRGGKKAKEGRFPRDAAYGPAEAGTTGIDEKALRKNRTLEKAKGAARQEGHLTVAAANETR